MDTLHKSPWDLSRLTPPWGTRPSIYQHIVSESSLDGSGFPNGDGPLPDDDQGWNESIYLFGPKKTEHQKSAEPSASSSKAFYIALRNLICEATDAHAATLYAIINERGDVRGDREYRVIRRIQKLNELDPDRLRQLGRWLATCAADSEAVNFGISLLGIDCKADDYELLLVFAHHESFTAEVSRVFDQAPEKPERQIWKLAQGTCDWGRIELVECLHDTEDPEIKAWLLREGYRNTVEYRYSTLTCAITGGLHEALLDESPDDALLKGAGEILESLMEKGGPVAGMFAYPEGVKSTELYMRHLSRKEVSFHELRIIIAIREFLAWCDEDETLITLGWPERRTALFSLIRSILARPDWKQRVCQGLLQADEFGFRAALVAADEFQIDTWDLCFERLQKGENQWYAVTHTTDPHRMDRVVALAEARFLLYDDQLEPQVVISQEPAFGQYINFECIIQGLADHPGKGWMLLYAALRDPFIRCRNAAIRILHAWGKANWPPEVEAYLRKVLEREPEERTRLMLRSILASE